MQIVLYIYIYTSRCLYSTYIDVHICMCVYIYIYVYVYACMHACMQSMYVCMHACMHACMLAGNENARQFRAKAFGTHTPTIGLQGVLRVL